MLEHRGDTCTELAKTRGIPHEFPDEFPCLQAADNKTLAAGGNLVNDSRPSPAPSIGQKTTFYDYSERQKMSPFELRKLLRLSP